MHHVRLHHQSAIAQRRKSASSGKRRERDSLPKGGRGILNVPRTLQIIGNPCQLIGEVHASLLAKAVGAHICAETVPSHPLHGKYRAGVERIIKHFLHRYHTSPFFVKIFNPSAVEHNIPLVVISGRAGYCACVKRCGQG